MTRMALVASEGPVTSAFVSYAQIPCWMTGRTCLEAIDGLVFAFGLVAFGNDRGDAVETSQRADDGSGGRRTSSRPC